MSPIRRLFAGLLLWSLLGMFTSVWANPCAMPGFNAWTEGSGIGGTGIDGAGVGGTGLGGSGIGGTGRTQDGSGLGGTGVSQDGSGMGALASVWMVQAWGDRRSRGDYRFCQHLREWCRDPLRQPDSDKY